MYLPRPYDGVILETDVPGQLVVRKVVPGSGADRAGIQAGDQIIGIARNALRSSTHAATLLNQHKIGEVIPYLIRNRAGLQETQVRLGPRRIGDTSYLYACLLGFSFFFVGVFVLLRQPRHGAGRIFFILCSLFLLFLVCRLRPASYSWADSFILTTGTAALLMLPATFLHFFLIFPQPVWQQPRPGPLSFLHRAKLRRGILAGLYVLPALVFAASLLRCQQSQREIRLISGAPVANWWVLAIYIVLGLTVLAHNAARLTNPRERRGAALVLVGSLLGLVPFLIFTVAFPSFRGSDKSVFYGVIPLGLVPLTFAYAIVRFQLLEIQVILRKSLLYTATTAAVTGVYALGIASFNTVFRGSSLADSPYFPIVFAMAIVLLFDPVRRWIQTPIDRFFFAERARLQEAMKQLGDALTARVDLEAVVRELVQKLPELLGLHFAALYLLRGDSFERVAGPPRLPQQLPRLPEAQEKLGMRSNLIRLERILELDFEDPEVERWTRALLEAGVEVVGDLSSPRRRIGLVLLSGKDSQMTLEAEELELLQGLLRQAAIALETGMLHEELTQQVEFERELEIAASIQASLLPATLQLAPGWQVAAVCRPARQVGGDFITELPGPNGGSRAIVYGDVSGKSIPGALMMMAAHEILHSLAMTHQDAEQLMNLANQRLYKLRNKSFVAMGYLACAPHGSLQYLLAGQPQLLKRNCAGEVEELPLSDHRLPLGAFPAGEYRKVEVPMRPGELVLGYSDGVVDTRSPEGEFFGSARLAQVLQSCAAEPQQLIQQILAALDGFARGTELYDDLTLVAIRYQPESA
jgi:serine phosphatase RsbU (regulator of sigma subunit)